MPAMVPVANTDRVSRYTQNVRANQSVELVIDATTVLTRIWWNVDMRGVHPV